jgi:hypothetical protein
VRAFSLNGYESTTIDDRVIQALGPDVALARRESSTWDAPAMSVDIEWTSVLPDSSVRVRRGGSDEWRRSIVADGFRGDALIYRRDESDPDPVTPFQAATAAERAAKVAARAPLEARILDVPDRLDRAAGVRSARRLV